MRVLRLATPPLPLLVPRETFDGFSWCASDVLEWHTPASDVALNALDDALPLRMAFVFRGDTAGLPAERAWLHTGRDQARAIGLSEEALALAPYALDDATDQLWAQRRAPGDTLWLAADNVNALYWALHDWAHFHNHGPFDDVTATEWQCDLCALTWMALNLDAIGLSFERFEQLCVDVVTEHRARTKKHQRPLADGLLGDARALADFAQRLAVAPGP